MVRKLPVLIGVAAAMSFGLAACGSDSSSATAEADSDTDASAPAATGPADQTIQISAHADGSLAFDQKSLKASAGTVALDFDNPASVGHNVCVRSTSGDELGCSEDISQSSTTLTVDLQPGRYVVYCGEPGHEEGGMTAPLSVS